MKLPKIGSKFTVPRPRKPFKITVTNVTAKSVIGKDSRGKKWRVAIAYLSPKKAKPKPAKPVKRRREQDERDWADGERISRVWKPKRTGKNRYAGTVLRDTQGRKIGPAKASKLVEVPFDYSMFDGPKRKKSVRKIGGPGWFGPGYVD